MDDAMYDMQTGSQNDGAGHEPVKCVLASWRPLCERCFSAV